VAAGSLYLVLSFACAALVLVAIALASLLFVVGRRREARAAEGREARRAARPQERDGVADLSDHPASDAAQRRGTP
jgi:hypothetical protein